jgi:nucleotide-binding universal stress UspA family protein
MPIWNRILATVDEHDSSMQAVRYLAGVLGGSDACRVRIMAVYQAPEPDAHPEREQRAAAAAGRKELLLERLEAARQVLVGARIPAYNVSTQLQESGGRTIAETIMATQRQGGFGTIVVGRRGLSKAEEFLFGSVSNSIVHQATDCAVWVIS